MKKILISATLLIGMMASTVLFCSFTTPNENETMNENLNEVGATWRRIGRYKGIYQIMGSRGSEYGMAYFTIWANDNNKAENMRWVYDGGGENEYVRPDGKNPSETRCATGYLKSIKVGAAYRYYCEYQGYQYVLEKFD